MMHARFGEAQDRFAGPCPEVGAGNCTKLDGMRMVAAPYPNRPFAGDNTFAFVQTRPVGP